MTRGTVTLVFDDGYEKVYKNIVPLLRRYSMPAVFAVPLNNRITPKNKHQQPTTPWCEWLSLKKYGHEIAAHSISHQDLTTLKADQVDKELSLPAQKLSATTLVYPGGAHNKEIIKQAKKYYTAARTTDHGLETTPPSDPYRLTTFDYTRQNFSLAKANARAVIALLTNHWLIETYHLVDNDEKNLLHTVSASNFSRHLAFINALPIKVKTIHEVISSKSRENNPVRHNYR